MLSKRGWKSLIYHYFRNKEKQLYKISDTIGCMSLANVEYIKKHNCELDVNKLELCPNCIEIQEISITSEKKRQLRIKYDIPLEKKVFVYGGNLGKPQDVAFIISCLKKCSELKEAYFNW
jgi:hypothetical protein